MSDEGNSPTTTSYVYGKLRADILRGQITAPAKLRIEWLSKRYGVGAIPLREALNRLTAEGIVALVDHKGFHLPAVSLTELHELTNTRCWLNEVVLRESLRCGDIAWEERVILASHRLGRTPRALTDDPAAINPEWDQLHRDFHVALTEACPSRWLKNYHATLFDYSDRYRHLYLSAVKPGRSRKVVREHEEMRDQAVQRNAPGLIEAYNRHIRLTTEIIARSVEARESPRDS